MNNEEVIILAGHAQEVLDNPAFKLVFERLRNGAMDALAGANLKDTEALLLYTQAYQTVNTIEKGLKKMLNDAKFSEVELKRRLGKSVKI